MCECPCGELGPIKPFQVEGEGASLAIDVYEPCESCSNGLSVTFYAFTPEGAKDFDLPAPEKIRADDYGSNEGKGYVFHLFEIPDLVDAAETLEIDLENYASLGDILEEYGYALIREAMRLRRGRPL